MHMTEAQDYAEDKLETANNTISDLTEHMVGNSTEHKLKEQDRAR